MGDVEAFLGAAVLGFGALLAIVAALAWRRKHDRKMAVLACAFGCAAAGGLSMLAGAFLGGAVLEAVPRLTGAATLASLVLLYGALFAPRN